MVKIEYLKGAPGARRGNIRSVDRGSARALVGLGYARLYETRVLKPVEPDATQPESAKPPAQGGDGNPPPAPDDGADSDKPKRQYRRRDMQAK